MVGSASKHIIIYAVWAVYILYTIPH